MLLKPQPVSVEFVILNVEARGRYDNGDDSREAPLSFQRRREMK